MIHKQTMNKQNQIMLMSQLQAIDSKNTFQQEIQKILKLQQLFHHKYLTPELLNELTSMYVSIVEVFNGPYRFMKTYFLEKMQFMLGQPEIIKILDGNKTGLSILIDDQNIDQDPLAFKKKISCQTPLSSKQKDSKINLQIRLMREVEENFKNFSKEVDFVKQKEETKHIAIKNIAKDQNDKLQERLRKRKRKERKNSVDHQTTEAEDTSEIKKQYLVEVQRQLTEAVQRFTHKIIEKERQSVRQSEEESIKIKRVEENEQISEVAIEEVDSDEFDSQKRIIDEHKNSRFW